MKSREKSFEGYNLFISIAVFFVTSLFLSNIILTTVNDPLMRDGSLLTGTRYTITTDALKTISEDNEVTVIGTGSSQMFKALDGGCVKDNLQNDAYVYNIAQPSSRPYTDMIHIPRIVEVNPEIVMIEIAPNLLLNTTLSSEDYVQLRFKLDTMNQDKTDLGGWLELIDPKHEDSVALTTVERMQFKQEYFPNAMEERLTRLLLKETNARDVDAYGWIPNSDSDLWFDYLQTPTFPLDRYGFDGKTSEAREEYNLTQMPKTGNYKPAYYNSQSHRALDYQISTLLSNEINVIIVTPPYHPLSMTHISENRWDGLNFTLDKYRDWPGVTIFDQTWNNSWEDEHFYDRNHLDDEGRLEFCERIAPVIDGVLNKASEKINFEDFFSKQQEALSSLNNELENTPPPRLMVLSINVEAGYRCADFDSNGDPIAHVSRCIWGEFAGQSAGIIEMMDIADKNNMKLSFFVDVLGIFSYGIDIIDVMQYIDQRGHDVQLRMNPSMVNSSSWTEILDSEEWINSGAVKDTHMSCWTQSTSDYWFKKSMDIFDDAGIERPIAFRSGGYKYCDTVIKSMANFGMTQSYNYNLFSNYQNFSFGYMQNFEWENGIVEFPVSYIIDENGELIVYSRLDESVYEQVWDVNSTLERFYSNQQEYRVLIMTMYSFSLLDKNDTGYFTLSETTKLDLFGEFLNNLPNEYEVVSTKQLQDYIDSGIIKTELVLSLDNLENECPR